MSLTPEQELVIDKIAILYAFEQDFDPRVVRDYCLEVVKLNGNIWLSLICFEGRKLFEMIRGKSLPRTSATPNLDAMLEVHEKLVALLNEAGLMECTPGI